MRLSHLALSEVVHAHDAVHLLLQRYLGEPTTPQQLDPLAVGVAHVHLKQRAAAGHGQNQVNMIDRV